MPDDELLKVDFFAARVGERFEVALEGREPYLLELTEARSVSGDSDARQPFSVIFRSAEELVLPQATYRLERAGMEPLLLFLVPLGPARGDESGLLYEAAFS